MRILYYGGLAAVVVICAGPTPAPMGYLEKLGPAPLRFKAPAKAPEEIVPLPPLAMKDPEPVEVLPTAAQTNAPAPEVNVETVQPVAPVALTTEPQSTTLTPQMLLQFFSDRFGTNQDQKVVVPYQFFAPPLSTSIPAPPSRAIYTTK